MEPAALVNRLDSVLRTSLQRLTPDLPTLAALVYFSAAVFVCVMFATRSFRIIRPAFRLHDRSKGHRFTLFLAHTQKFSLEPYAVVRRALEIQGQEEEAREVYYAMRAREINEGEASLPMKVIKWIFFVAAGSGVRIWPLVCFLCMFFCFSWLAVFSNPDSVEHPSTFVTHANEHASESHEAATPAHPAREGPVAALAITTPPSPAGNAHPPPVPGEMRNPWSHRTGAAPGPSWQSIGSAKDTDQEAWPFQSKVPAKEYGEPVWTWRDGFWMAIKVHVPLIHLWAKEKWEPAAVQGWYYCPVRRETFDSHHTNLHMRPMWWGMEYETYAVIAQIVSYLTLPMLISALGGFYRSHESGAHGHSHGPTHSHAKGHSHT